MGDFNDLHEHLKNLIEKSPIAWTYAILWECSSQRRVLRFKDGYHRGSGKPKEIRIMGSCISVAEHATDNDAATQFFFKISKGQSFEINDDLPGYALVAPTPVWITVMDKGKWWMWERTKWAQQFGIRTFLCLPLKDKKVLELASSDISIAYNNIHIHWLQQNLDPIGTLSTPLQNYTQQLEQQLEQLEQQRLQQLVQRLCPPGEQQKQQTRPLQKQQPRLRSEEMKDRGKEKISNSKCSWTLFTESSDRGTERTFSCSHDYSGPS